MNKNQLKTEQNQPKQTLSQTGINIECLNDLSRQAKEMITNSEIILIKAQQKVEDLCLSLESDDVAVLSNKLYLDTSSD